MSLKFVYPFYALKKKEQKPPRKPKPKGTKTGKDAAVIFTCACIVSHKEQSLV